MYISDIIIIIGKKNFLKKKKILNYSWKVITIQGGSCNKNNEKDKYLEIINKIESFEQETYTKIKPFNTFDNEIKLFTNINEMNEIKYKIEKVIFSNKSILFLNDLLIIDNNKRFFFNENNIKILLILNDIYLRINNNNNSNNGW